MLASPGLKNKFICSKNIKLFLIIFEHINLFLSHGLASKCLRYLYLDNLLNKLQINIYLKLWIFEIRSPMVYFDLDKSTLTTPPPPGSDISLELSFNEKITPDWPLFTGWQFFNDPFSDWSEIFCCLEFSLIVLDPP